jgi:Ca2+-binding EF-hand superfamily protein
MATDKKHSGKVDINNLDEWLRSTGFLFPINELQLTRFNELYVDYDFKLKDASIDVKSIVGGNLCSNDIRVLRVGKNDEINNEIEELRMVARKGQEVPKHIIDKMKKKHRKNNDGEKQ